jgi:hypothetical protein
MATQPPPRGPFGLPLRRHLRPAPEPEVYTISDSSSDEDMPAMVDVNNNDIIVIDSDSTDSEAEEEAEAVEISSDSDSEAESVPEENNLEDVLHVAPLGPLRQRPPCHRRANQQVPCIARDRGVCRMAVALLALEEGELVVRNDNREVRIPVNVGLHFVTWCSANMFFMGMPLSRPNNANMPPIVGYGRFIIEHATPDEVSWMAANAIFNREPGPRSFVFPLMREPPSLLAVFSTGPGEVIHLARRPNIDLEWFLPGASYHALYLAPDVPDPVVEVIDLD